MPYTHPANRRAEQALRSAVNVGWTKGDLTWAISVLMDEYVLNHGVSYAVLSDARASAADAHDEWYRRVMAPYEDKKWAQNGEVYRVVGKI